MAPVDRSAEESSGEHVPELEPGADLERRFGGLRRLYGEAGYAKLRAARFAIVGLGGVGSWAAEALARSGVAELVLVDLDHVAESNVNRQVQALTPTLGQAKVRSLAERIALIHPGCKVHALEEFADADTWPALLPASLAGTLDGLIDACDDVRAKEVLARWSLEAAVPGVFAGAAGGKRRPEAVQVADLLEVTHDPLLAALRQRLRRAGLLTRGGEAPGTRSRQRAANAPARCGLACVFSREPVAPPQHGREPECAAPADDSGLLGGNDGSLNCHGYGSSVMVTATFGLVAAATAVSRLLDTCGSAPAQAA